MDIIHSSQFQQDCQNYKKSKESAKHISKYIQHTIDQNTKNEVQAVQDSIKRLNSKIESVLNTPEMDEKKTQLKSVQKSMMNSLSSVMNIYSQAREVIMNDKSLQPQVRMEYLKKLEDKMMDRLYTKEEKEQFKRMLNHMVFVMSNNEQRNPTIKH